MSVLAEPPPRPSLTVVKPAAELAPANQIAAEVITYLKTINHPNILIEEVRIEPNIKIALRNMSNMPTVEQNVIGQGIGRIFSGKLGYKVDLQGIWPAKDGKPVEIRFTRGKALKL